MASNLFGQVGQVLTGGGWQNADQQQMNQYNSQMNAMAQNQYGQVSPSVASAINAMAARAAKKAELTEEEHENFWFRNEGDQIIKTDFVVLRTYLLTKGIDFKRAMSMPVSLVKKLAKGFCKLEGNIDTAIIYALMEDE